MNRALVAGSALALLVGGALFAHGTAVAHKMLALAGVGLIMLGLVLVMKPLLDWCDEWDRLTPPDQAIDIDSEDESNDLAESVVF